MQHEGLAIVKSAQLVADERTKMFFAKMPGDCYVA